MCFLRISLFVLTFIVITINCNTLQENYEEGYCLSNDPNPFGYFATKTPYEFVRGDFDIPSDENCTPIQIWFMSRHGTRFGTKGNLAEMKQAIRLKEEILLNYESGIVLNGLCEADLQALKNWTWDQYAESQAGLLNSQGWDDLNFLAKRYQEMFPGLFRNYSSERFYFRHTLSERTQESCYAFIDGLFGDGAHGYVNVEEATEIDDIIKPYDNCQAWKEEVGDNPETFSEILLFHQSPQYKKLQSDISKRLGYSRILTPEEIEAMYDNCRLDKSRYLDILSAWCSVFTKEELILLEYENDLGQFYKSGPSHQYNPKLGCMPLKHLRETFSETINNNGINNFTTIAMFTHDTMMDLTFSALKYNDAGFYLNGTDFENVLNERLYRTSFNSPFATNFAAVLHACSNSTDVYKVQFIHNERPMNIEGCPSGMCTWDHLNNFLSFTSECNLDFCDRN